MKSDLKVTNNKKENVWLFNVVNFNGGYKRNSGICERDFI